MGMRGQNLLKGLSCGFEVFGMIVKECKGSGEEGTRREYLEDFMKEVECRVRICSGAEVDRKVNLEKDFHNALW